MPARVVPAGSSPTFDGLRHATPNRSGRRTYAAQHGTHAMTEPMRVPRWDPNEEYEFVVRQLFGDENAFVPTDPWSTEATITGFASDYDAIYDDPAEAMGAYDEHQLPVLSGLARRFAVSDRWLPRCRPRPTRTAPLAVRNVPRRRGQSPDQDVRGPDDLQRPHRTRAGGCTGSGTGSRSATRESRTTARPRTSSRRSARPSTAVRGPWTRTRSSSRTCATVGTFRSSATWSRTGASARAT